MADQFSKRVQVAAVAAAIGVVALAGGRQADAASSCGVQWAEPGKYKIAGSFRGKSESTNAFLSKDCRITLQVPGVFTGGKVKSIGGNCLEFMFKIEGDTETFRAKWCDDYGLVPWQGKTLRAAVTPLFKRSKDAKANF